MLTLERLPRDIVVIGASAGRVPTLIEPLSNLPVRPALVGTVLHRSPCYGTRLRPVLGWRAVVPVREPEDGTPSRMGVACLAPRDTWWSRAGPGTCTLAPKSIRRARRSTRC